MSVKEASRQISVHLSYILGTYDLAQRFERANALGFNAVEYPFPYDTPASIYRSWLETHGLSQISIGAPACDYKTGQPGFSLSPDHRPAFDASIDTAMAYALEIGCKNVHVFAGGRPPNMTEDEIFDTYCKSIDDARDRLAAEGLGLVIEAINATDFQGYFMNRLDRIVAVTDQIGRDNIGVILDTYHAGINGEDATDFLAQHPDLVAHLQLADVPGRHEPGSGSFDFDALFDVVDDSGYRGSIGLEYVPTRPIAEGVPLRERLFA